VAGGCARLAVGIAASMLRAWREALGRRNAASAGEPAPADAAGVSEIIQVSTAQLHLLLIGFGERRTATELSELSER
jgi:hypothetical protein